jgi:hypothetical protein
MNNYRRPIQREYAATRREYGYRFQNRAERRGVRTFTYTFTNDIGGEYTIQERFDQIAHDIQRTIRDFYSREGDARAENPYLITLEGDGANGFTQRTVRTINGITGNFLKDSYENILQSNEVIQLEGFKV